VKCNHFELKTIAFDDKIPNVGLELLCSTFFFFLVIRNSSNKRRIETRRLSTFCPKCGAYLGAVIQPGNCR